MATPEERIAAGQELRKRGKLSSQQDAALKELERRYGLSAAPAVGQRGSMVEEGAISREEYMAQRGGVGFGGRPVPKEVGTYAGGPMATYADEGLLGKKPVASEAMIRDVGATKLALETPQDMNVNKMSRAQSVALGVNDLNPVRLATGDRGYEVAMTESLRDNPVSTRLGQAAAFTAGGGAQLGVKALTVAPKLVAPAVAARFAGQGIGAQAARYTGRGALLAGTGAADYYAYNALAEAPNQFREQGLGRPTVGDRIDYANSQVFTPGGAIAAGLGPLASIIYRPVRAAVAGGKNLVTTGTARPAVTAGRPTLPAAAGQSAKAPLTNLFTPSNIQRNVAAITPTTPSKRGRTAREEAIDLLLAKGLKADETEKLVRQISYDNYTNVDEMLFELANADVDQLAVAAARVGGEAKKTFREAFKTRAAEMPERIRTQLRDAMALSGDDLETFAAQMTARADDATADGYKAAYAQQVSDDTWAKMWDRLSVSPDTADAIAAGARLAKNSYRGNPAQLEVARQLDELAGALRSPDVTPPKLSTHALDYLDRGFGSLIAGQKKNNPAFASSLIEIQKAIRSAGLDADTGLDVPRGVYSQYKAASRGIDFGAKAFGRGTPLRDIKKQFSASLKDADEVFEDIVGEGRSVVDQALVMGWLRGAEDAIETATNPGALIRQIYGSERQRAKLMEMMPQETDVMTSGVKGDQTKRIKALVGSALGAEDYKFGFTLGSGVRAEGRAAVPSLFERQRTMLENQGRVSGNSVTGEVTEAIANQGGLQRAADLTARALMNPQDAARNAMLWAVQKVTTPAIFKPEVNRELGRILTTRGRDELLAVVAELRARQAATARRTSTPPAGGAPPVPPANGTPPATPPAGGSASGRTVGKSKLGTRTSGIVGNSNLTNAAFGAGLGGIAPADSPEERARNMAIGAGIGIVGGSRTVGKVLGVKGDDVARTAGVGGGRGAPTSKFTQQAVEHFGLTNSIDEAGYMLPDGRMLDLSGRHDMLEGDYIRQGTKNVATGRDWQAGQRNTDHRELPFSVVSGDTTANMLAFQKEAGAIRIMPGTGISVVSVPDRSQIEKLVRAWKRRYGNEPMLVDVDDLNGRNISSVEVENVTVDSVLKAFGSTPPPIKGMGFGAGGGRKPQQAANLKSDDYAERVLSGEMNPTSDELYEALRVARKNDSEMATELKALAEVAFRLEKGAVTEVITDAFKKLPLANEIAQRREMGYAKLLFGDERVAIASIRRAIGEAKLLGQNPEQVFNEALAAYTRRFSDPQDAAFMRKSITDLINMGGLEKPPSKLGTRTADAAAIATLGLQGGTAEADTGGASAELETANARVETATKRVADVDKSIVQLEADMRLLEDPNANPFKVQELLARRGFDLGPKGIDGRIGKDTREAIADNIAKIEGDIARKGSEREKAAAEVEAARNGVTQAEMRQSLLNAEINPYAKTAGDLLHGAAFLGGFYLAGRARKGAVKEYSKAAKTAATKANMLLNRGQLYPNANVGPNSNNVRTANLNEFWKQGGAKSRVPFTADDQGQLSARKGAKEPSQLFKAPRFIDNDKKFMLAMGVESQGTKYIADKFQSEVEKSEAEMERAKAAGDSVSFDAAVKARNNAMIGETIFRTLERAGYGAFAGRAVGGLKKYPAINANIKAAEAERNLILQGLKKQREAAQNNPASGKPKP